MIIIDLNGDFNALNAWILDNVFSDYDIDLDDIDSDIVTSSSDGMSLITIDLNNINLNDDSFDEDDPTNIFLLDLLFVVIDLNNVKHKKR